MRSLRISLLACVLALAATLGLVANSFAASAPGASSSAATGVTGSTAILNGHVNPEGSATEYAFQWGPSTSYGEETSLTDAGSGTATADAAAELTGLNSGSTYHYRLIAISAAGTSVGGDESFKTTGTAPKATAKPDAGSSVSSGSITTTSATLSGTVNPEGQSTNDYYEWGPTDHYGFLTPATSAGSGTSSVAATATLTNLTPGVEYYYKLVAVSAGGVDVGGSSDFRTLEAPAVASEAATNVTSTSALLSGSVDPEYSTTKYIFQYGTTSAYGTFGPGGDAGDGSAAAAVSGEILGLKAGTTYHYRLVAYNAGGTTNGPDETFTTPAVASSKPGIVGTLAYVPAGGSQVSVLVDCLNGQTRCAGTLSLIHNGVSIGTKQVSYRAGGVAYTSVTLTKPGLKLLAQNRRGHLLRVTATLVSSGVRITHTLSIVHWVYKG